MSQFTTSHDEDTGASAKAGAATHEAADTAKAAGHAAQGVVESSAHEAAAVASEAKAQLGDLVAQSGRELSDHAATQQQRVADSLSTMGDDLTRMADADENGGIAGDLVRRAAGHVTTVGSWLADRDPQQLMKDVASFARRRPGTFIAVAAVAGIVAGRLGRAIAAGSTDGGATAGGSHTPSASGGPLFADADAAARRTDEPAGSDPSVPIATAPAVGGGLAGSTAVVDDAGRTDDTGLIDDADGGDPPLYTESAARLDGIREEGSHDRPDTV